MLRSGSRLGQTMLLILSTLVGGCASPGGWTIQPSGRLQEPDLNESSGLVASRQFRDVLWTHNDDGEPEIFAVNRSGRLLSRVRLAPARNIDWEEIAIDESDNLYVLDNTSRVFETRTTTIYVFPEPDPRGSAVRTIRPTRVLEIPTPGLGLDIEAMFCWQGAIYFIDKPWDSHAPRVYRTLLESPGLGLEDLGSLPVTALVTGADIDRPGTRIAVSSYRGVFVFEGPGDPLEILHHEPLVSPLNARQVEAIAWQGDDLVLSNEERDIFFLRRSQWQSGNAPFFRSAKQDFPRLDSPPDVTSPLSQWNAGRWLRARASNGQEITLGRVAWSGQGLHVGIQLPTRTVLEGLGSGVAEGFLDWFKPGRLYLMINPSGSRDMTYQPEDRCVVIGLDSGGKLMAQARTLRPGTQISSSEDAPSWVQLSQDRDRLLVTLTSDTPGLGILQVDRKIGFNLLIIAEDGMVLSWTPLTLRFSWDNPGVWGMLETKR